MAALLMRPRNGVAFPDFQSESGKILQLFASNWAVPLGRSLGLILQPVPHATFEIGTEVRIEG